VSRETVIFRLMVKIERYQQLYRGWWWQRLGTHAGLRFGVSKDVKIYYPSNLHVGDDVTILGPAFLSCLSDVGVHIGSQTSIDRNLWLHCGSSPNEHSRGFFIIGDHSYIGCNAVMGAGGGVTIGNHVLIGQSVNIHAENHKFMDPGLLIDQQGLNYQGVVIKDDVWVGSKVTILDGVTIGKGAVIGAGAVVTSAIPDYAIAVGIPATVRGFRNKPE